MLFNKEAVRILLHSSVKWCHANRSWW